MSFFVKRIISTLTAVLFFLTLFTVNDIQAQFSIETTGIISSESNTPFWFDSNRNGIYSREGSQFLTRLQYHNLFDEWEDIDILYGASLIARPGDQSTVSLNQGYVKIQGYGLELAGGRFVDPSPLYDHPLGMGSLGISTNATPIPKLKFGLIDWTPIPFTNNFIHIQGFISHGWLGSERYVNDVLLHEKAGYVKFGGDHVLNIYGGLAHYVLWGGNSPDPSVGDIPSGFSDFIDIFFAQSGDEATPGQDQAYVLGNQLGTWAFGSLIELPETNINIYLQAPIETKYDLKFKNMNDILTGISVDFDEDFNFPIDNFVYEYLYTKNQGGERRLNPDADPSVDLYRGNQNYYNHGIYKTGWAYQFRMIGNPLFKLNEENLGILNNRIVAHHIGVESDFEAFDLFGKVTYSRNYGKRCDNRVPNLGEQELFGIRCENTVDTLPGRVLEQWSILAGAEFPLPIIPNENISLRIEAALDNGRLFGDQFGVLTSIIWSN
nr:capsule assembly Wzi family protein [Rhodohalobacter sp. 614A]